MLECLLSILLTWTNTGQEAYQLQTSYDGTNWCNYVTVVGTTANVVGSTCTPDDEGFSVQDLNGNWHTYMGQIREQLFRVVSTNGLPITLAIKNQP